MNPVNRPSVHYILAQSIQQSSFYCLLLLLLPLTLLIVDANNTPGPISQPTPSTSDIIALENHSEIPIQKEVPSISEENVSPSPSSVALDAEAEGVFIPLKEWKRRKLEEVESKVRTLDKSRDANRAPSQLSSMITSSFIVLNSTCRTISLRSTFFRQQHPWCPLPDTIHQIPRARKRNRKNRDTMNVTQNGAETKNPDSAILHDHSSNGSIESLDNNNDLATENLSHNSRQQIDRKYQHMETNDLNENDDEDKPSMETHSSSTDEMMETSKNEDNTAAPVESSSTESHSKYENDFVVGSMPSIPITNSIRGASGSASSKPIASISNISSESQRSQDKDKKKQANPDSSILFASIKPVSESGNEGDSENKPSLELISSEKDSKPTDDYVSSNDKNTETEQKEGKIKERPFNFASDDAGARVLGTSKNTVGANNVLTKSLDKYLLSPCTGAGLEAGRWVDLELSEEIILKRIETGNFEFYSSSARKIIILGAKTYPPQKWDFIGHFDFLDKRNLQRFEIKQRAVARYLRVIYAGKQGHERYCPISTIRVFGKNLIADWIDFDSPREEKAHKDRNPSTKVIPSDAQSRKMAYHSKEENSQKTDTSIGSSANGDSIQCTTANCENGFNVNLIERPNEQLRNEDIHIESSPHTTTKNTQGYPYNQNDQDHLTSTTNTPSKRPSKIVTPGSISNSIHPDSGQARPSHRIPYRRDLSTSHPELSEDDQIVVDAVRSDTLAPLSGEDNIFRRVTRMLRLLELNQTLTNQYIDSQLSNFARAFTAVKMRSDKIERQIILSEQQRTEISTKFEASIRELKSSALKRDILICALLISVAFLLGTHWVVWTAVNSARIHGTSLEEAPISLTNSFGSHQDSSQAPHSASTSPFNSESDAITETKNPAKDVRRRKRKGKDKSVSMDQSSTLHPNHTSSKSQNKRSISSVDISSMTKGRTSKPGTSNTFDVLSDASVL